MIARDVPAGIGAGVDRRARRLVSQADRLFAPHPTGRFAARLRRSSLDRALSEGADPSESPAIAARAWQLQRPSSRARIADGLERLALAAEQPGTRARVTPSRPAITANRADLLGLAGRLRHDPVLYAPGLATLELLLTDGTGPAFTDRRGEALARQLEMAQRGLGGRAEVRPV